MKLLKPKVSIIGAGNVGMRYAYALLMKGIAREIVMIDADKRRAEGEVMDLSHGAPFISPCHIIAGDYKDIVDSDLVVITAGKKQKDGQTRMDLAKDNVGLYRDIIPQIMKNSPDSIILVVTNPIDVLSYAAYKLSGKPSNKVIGSGTVLDSARFRFMISHHCHVDPRNVHAYILGEHGDTEFAVWSKAMIGGVPIDDFCLFCKDKDTCDKEAYFNGIFKEVRDSAYKIIERKHETSYGIGLALVKITEAILKDQNSILPVSNLVNGYLGIKDVYLSLPAVVNKDGIREVLNIGLNKKEENELIFSAEAIKKVIKASGI